jgi:hypothetical protein
MCAARSRRCTHGPQDWPDHWTRPADLVVYHASADDTRLVGREFLFSPDMHILRQVSYVGGFRPPSEGNITAREVFDEILKPCRSRYLLLRKSSQECDFRGLRCRYTYETKPNEECEVIALETGRGWETIHEVSFFGV